VGFLVLPTRFKMQKLINLISIVSPKPKASIPEINPFRQDLIQIPLATSVYLDIYLRVLHTGVGTTVIFKAFRKEVLKYDAFVEGMGHCHLLQPEKHCPDRLFLPEGNIESQIQRIIFDLKFNLYYWLKRNSDRRIRSINIDPVVLEKAIDQAEKIMVAYIPKAQALQNHDRLL